MYLTVIIGLFDRKVIGWAMSKGMSPGRNKYFCMEDGRKESSDYG